MAANTIDCLRYALFIRGVWSLSLARTTVETWNFKREEDFKMDEVFFTFLSASSCFLNMCKSLWTETRLGPRGA